MQQNHGLLIKLLDDEFTVHFSISFFVEFGKFMFSNDPLLRVLDRMGCGAIIVDGSGQFLLSNNVSETIISEYVEYEVSNESKLREGFKLLLSGSGHRFRIDSESWAVIPRKNRKPIAIYSIPLGNESDPYENSVVIIIDMEKTQGPSVEVLQRIFNLSPAEASIALLILEGKTPLEIASFKRLSQWTIRTQLAAIYNKTKTRRQSELVTLLLRISILP
ncbi:helix-turn-helix transcriptional regulator [Methylobacterium sp. SD274]|uniref:helix-turn-helix transcriptional regulator n=1 Tax=Methylobacterium sp. SD274 TaxID=2782009 RepID=UPI001A96031A|nr:helix-turn-helix transcriptional regulator [Methylobacterium sp. SD274]MBO1023070.1 helix-turn-helix transcriptional regulator [Methylobacterium sp. SD274]